jgi:hypothetical protein
LQRWIKFPDGRGRINYERILAHKKEKRGYLVVNLSVQGKHHMRLVHRLVAFAFLSNPDNKHDINHINGVKNDNRVENLEWATRGENIQHAYKTGLIPKREHYFGNTQKGESHWRTNLSASDVWEIYIIGHSGTCSRKELGLYYNTTRTAIDYIINNRNWSHLKLQQRMQNVKDTMRLSETTW